MKKLIIFYVLCFCLISSRVSANSLAFNDKQYYWFYVQLGKSLDKETNTNRISIKRVGNEIESGSFNEFLKRHKEGLISGKIYIGPFSEMAQSQDAQKYYRNPGKSGGTENTFGFDDTYSYFYLKPIAEDLSRNVFFEQIPSRITSGSLEDFMSMLDEGLNFERLAIGPFNDYELAEKSKFVYRKNNTPVLNNGEDSSRIQALKIMAKKWKTLNLEIIKLADKKELNSITYRFNTKFSRKYFEKDAFQIITIRALYTEPVDNSSNSFTLQGDGVVDNNPVISNEMGTVYINVLNFDKHKDNKIKGFSFESFIYNDYEMIELEPTFIPVK